MTRGWAPGGLSIDYLEVLVYSHAIMASKVYQRTRMIAACKFARSWPPSASSKSFDHGLQVSLQVCTITASKCMSNLAWLRPASSARSWSPNASPNLLNQYRGVEIYGHSIAATKYISKLARLRPASLYDHGLQVHLQNCWITILECIYMFPRPEPPSVSANTLD